MQRIRHRWRMLDKIGLRLAAHDPPRIVRATGRVPEPGSPAPFARRTNHIALPEAPAAITSSRMDAPHSTTGAQFQLHRCSAWPIALNGRNKITHNHHGK